MVRMRETEGPSRAPVAYAVAPQTAIGTATAGAPKLLGHKDVKTTMIYTHVLNRGAKGVKSPVDDL